MWKKRMRKRPPNKNQLIYHKGYVRLPLVIHKGLLCV